MKKMLIALAILIGLSGVSLGISFADEAQCPPGQSLRLIGDIKAGATQLGVTASSSGGTISTQGVEVRRIMVSCGGTACVQVHIVDEDTIAAAVDADYVIDPTVAANTTLTLDFMDTPLVFSKGLSVGDSQANVTAIAAYACVSD